MAFWKRSTKIDELPWVGEVLLRIFKSAKKWWPVIYMNLRASATEKLKLNVAHEFAPIPLGLASIIVGLNQLDSYFSHEQSERIRNIARTYLLLNDERHPFLYIEKHVWHSALTEVMWNNPDDLKNGPALLNGVPEAALVFLSILDRVTLQDLSYADIVSDVACQTAGFLFGDSLFSCGIASRDNGAIMMRNDFVECFGRHLTNGATIFRDLKPRLRTI